MNPVSMKALPIQPLLRQSRARLLSLRLPLPGWMRNVGWRVFAAAVLLGGIVHICAVLAVPGMSSGHAYQLLHDRLPPNRMVVLLPQTPDRQILPYFPPDAVYAMCRYDLSGGPVAVTAVVADAGWALSLHTPQGANFYVLPGQRLRHTEVTLLVALSGEDAASVPEPESPVDTHITSPTAEGLIVLRAPLRGLAWRGKTEATLRRATCTQVKQ